MKLHFGCSMCRRANEKLFLKGERCESAKCAIIRRKYAPGMHGPKPRGRGKLSNYGAQLRMKQKTKQIYGIREKQFRNLLKRESRKKGDLGINLLQKLESRLDNLVFRANIATSRFQARQLVSHGHFALNGKRVDIPSIQISPKDLITVRKKSQNSPFFQERLKSIRPEEMPAWISWDMNESSLQMISLPSVEAPKQIIDTKQIIEFYSR